MQTFVLMILEANQHWFQIPICNVQRFYKLKQFPLIQPCQSEKISFGTWTVTLLNSKMGQWTWWKLLIWLYTMAIKYTGYQKTNHWRIQDFPHEWVPMSGPTNDNPSIQVPYPSDDSHTSRLIPFFLFNFFFSHSIMVDSLFLGDFRTFTFWSHLQLIKVISYRFINCGNVSHYKDGWAVNFNFFHKGIIGSLSQNASIKAIDKHESNK